MMPPLNTAELDEVLMLAEVIRTHRQALADSVTRMSQMFVPNENMRGLIELGRRQEQMRFQQLSAEIDALSGVMVGIVKRIKDGLPKKLERRIAQPRLNALIPISIDPNNLAADWILDNIDQIMSSIFQES